MSLILPSHPALHPYVACVWAGACHAPAPGGREHALPTGRMHLALRVDGAAVRLFADADDRVGEVVGDAVVAGARAGYYIKDRSTPARSVGVQLRPGAALALFGVSAAELHGRHVPLDALWGAEAARLRERLHAARDPQAQLETLQSALRARLRPLRALHPAVAQALARIEAGADGDGPAIRALVATSGTSHRHFIACFRDATGLSPKRYARVRRFRRLLRAYAAAPARPWAELALAAGYSDQSHCIRDFREFAGVTPQAWRRAAGARPWHLPAPR
jgi:AraC-like DNA-binding protein